MKTYLPRITAFLALATSSAYAHPGHPGHEDWPFPDFTWPFAIGALIIVGATIYKLRNKGGASE